MGMSSGNGDQPTASINVTPLVDVCLVLLIMMIAVGAVTFVPLLGRFAWSEEQG